MKPPSLPEWLSECTSLVKLDLSECYSLVSLPDLSSLKNLRVDLPKHLEPWRAGGFKAWDFIADGWPRDSTEIDLSDYRGTSLPEWLSECTSLVELNLDGCKSLVSLPDLSSLENLEVYDLPEHLEPWRSGGFKAWDLEAQQAGA